MGKNEKDKNKFNIGGQAVMEGVMMRGKNEYAMAVRKQDGQLYLEKQPLVLITEKYPILSWPIIRGIAAFGSSLSLGFKTLMKSADITAEGIMDDTSVEPSKFEKFLQNKLGDKLEKVIVYVSVAIAIIIAIGMFVLLPVFIGSMFAPLLSGRTGWLGVIEGVVRIIIFLLYVWLASFANDIKRVYQYHGAEHKTIHCYEAGEPLKTENVRRYSCLHKRCGTSFLLIVMIISMVVLLFVKTETIWLRFLSRLLLIPVIAGISYEVIKWAGNCDNLLVKIVSFPGLSLQRITTAEPDDLQIETAVAAMQALIEDDAPCCADDKPCCSNDKPCCEDDAQ